MLRAPRIRLTADPAFEIYSYILNSVASPVSPFACLLKRRRDIILNLRYHFVREVQSDKISIYDQV